MLNLQLYYKNVFNITHSLDGIPDKKNHVLKTHLSCNASEPTITQNKNMIISRFRESMNFDIHEEAKPTV